MCQAAKSQTPAQETLKIAVQLVRSVAPEKGAFTEKEIENLCLITRSPENCLNQVPGRITRTNGKS